MIDYKELYEIQLRYISSEREAEQVLKTLDLLNQKLRRHDSATRQKNHDLAMSNQNDYSGKIKLIIEDIFDNYSSYNALDKKEIQETLTRIQKISRSKVNYFEPEETTVQEAT